jgi:hypothetical protein
VDDRVKVGKGGSQYVIELAGALPISGAARLRRVIYKVLREELLEHGEIALALNFLGVAADDSLSRLARGRIGHDASPMV